MLFKMSQGRLCSGIVPARTHGTSQTWLSVISIVESYSSSWSDLTDQPSLSLRHDPPRAASSFYSLTGLIFPAIAGPDVAI